MMRLLDNINDPRDLKGLSLAQLKQLAQEIRTEIIQGISRTGGHFAPNLGVVEITIALHSLLDSPRDKIVWDVGHQSYPHKLLTGRRDRFHTIKQLGGISGYCKRSETPHDCWEAGHGSTSIAGALGFARARDLRGGDETVVAVIGDGSLTGGLAYEALNNAGHSHTSLIIILNDNAMSIAPNVGALAKYLGRARSDPRYLWAKQEIEQIVQHLPLGDRIWQAVHRMKDGAKQLLIHGMLFEELGLTYLGPIDGHDIEIIRVTLEQAKRIGGPVLIHAITQKGKGYAPAEANPFKWHATSGFDPETGEPRAKGSGKPTYSKVFAQSLIRLAQKDPKIVAITAAMPDGTGLIDFQKVFPERFYDVGMAEQYAVCFAAGLAAAGKRPVAAIYSTFLQRAYDQVIHDVCVQNLPVVLCLDRGGIAGEDGPTHQGAFDIAYLRCLPNMVVMAPRDDLELQRMLATALRHNGPIAVRYPRATGTGAPILDDPEPLPIGVGEILRDGHDVALVGFGYGVEPALGAADLLAAEGFEAMVVDPRFAKPLDLELLVHAARRCGVLVTIEDGVRMGGFGSGVLELFQDHGLWNVPVLRLGLPDQFIEHGARPLLLQKWGLDAAGVAASVKSFLRNLHLGPSTRARVTAGDEAGQRQRSR
ncbi:MAG: 1-deoxy-D-xylulose-5-phosphate synthase [Armatimonadetes bacterium]|nr:1-deoxy-D-xylulose-5-phosphate synthase [Armatimonadota bacterium]